MMRLSNLVPVVLLGACSVGSTHWPSPDEYSAFEKAGPIEPELDVEQFLSGIPKPGPYQVVADDLLEIRGAGGFLVGAGTGSDVVQARVQASGKIDMPLLGGVQVVSEGTGHTGDQVLRGGKTLGQIETAIADALHPRLLAQRPAIVVRVLEPARVPVAVFGAVERPGVVELASNQLSLFGALSAAGGIIKASNLKVGARLIRVRGARAPLAQAVVLPVKGLNIPMADMALVGGETIEVERWDPEIFTVVGLVVAPGAYEHAPGRKYNLMQAIAMAGGIDRVADPPYASVFRRDATGNIVAATFGISGNDLVRASSIEIRPGDIVAVEHTVGSWTRTLLATVLKAQVNFLVDPLNSR